MGDLAAIESTARMNSRTLEGALKVDVTVGTDVHQITLHLPFYWAVYHHDGRGEINAPAGKFLVYFPDIRDDPRVDGGSNYPHSRSEHRRLTKQQFRDFLKINRARALRGERPIMVVTKQVGPASGFFYFSDAAAQLAQDGSLAEVASLALGQALSAELPLRGSGRAVIAL